MLASVHADNTQSTEVSGWGVFSDKIRFDLFSYINLHNLNIAAYIVQAVKVEKLFKNKQSNTLIGCRHAHTLILKHNKPSIYTFPHNLMSVFNA